MWLGPSQLHLDELFSPAIAGTLPREGGTINIVELIRSADSLQKLQMQLEKMHLCRVSSFAVYGSGRGSAMTWWYVHCFALFHNVLHADVLSNVFRTDEYKHTTNYQSMVKFNLPCLFNYLKLSPFNSDLYKQCL